MVQPKYTKPPTHHPRRKISFLAIGILIACGVIIAIAVNSKSSRPVPMLTLHSNPQTAAATYNGIPIIEACNTLSPDELGNHGIALNSWAATTGIFSRVYIEAAQGTTPLPEGILSHNEDAPNSCRYLLQDLDELHIRVYQPTYSDMQALDKEIADDYEALPDMGDVRAYQETTYSTTQNDSDVPDGQKPRVSTNKGTEDFILQKGNAALRFRLDSFSLAKRKAVLRVVAGNFSRLVEKPEARATPVYRDPLFQKIKPIQPCRVLTPQSASLLIGQNLSSVAEERYQGAPAQNISTPAFDKSKNHPYIAQTCLRIAGELRNHLSLELRQYTTEEGAKQFMQSGKNSTEHDWQRIAPPIGDETYASTRNEEYPEENDSRLYVRKGSLMLSFSFRLRHATEEPDINKIVELLRPVVMDTLHAIEQPTGSE